MPWKPLPRIAFAICTYPFQPSSAADLPLQIGDELYIIEQGGANGDWFRGYLVAPPSLLAGLTATKGQPLEARVFSGIFPRACVEIQEELGEVAQNGHIRSMRTSMAASSVGYRMSTAFTETPRISGIWPMPPHSLRNNRALDSSTQGIAGALNSHSVGPDDDLRVRKPLAPVPMLKVGDETASAGQEPLVDEIASCLREWHSTNLHELLLGRNYELLEEISELVNRLDSARRQLLHKILTQREMDEVREAATWDLVRGNKLLSGEVIVRSGVKRGRMLTADDSAVDMSSLQASMSLLGDQNLNAPNPSELHHILFNLKSFKMDASRVPTLFISLHTADSKGNANTLSESFAIDAPPLENEDGDESLRALFTDLNANDLRGPQGEKLRLYLVIKVLTNQTLKEPDYLPTPGNQSANNSVVNVSKPQPSTWRNQSLRGPMGMLKSRARKDSETTTATSTRPPTAATTAASTRAPTPEGTRPNSSSGEHDRESRRVAKRTTGIALLDITDLLRVDAQVERDISVWSLTSRSKQGDTDPAKDSIDQIIVSALSGLPRDTAQATPNSKAKISLQSFSHADSEHLVESTPTLLANTPLTRRLGFGEAPSRPRSDIYITITQPLFTVNTLLSHPRFGTVQMPPVSELNNLQVTLEVRNAAGDRIDGCIYSYSTSMGHTAWRTTAVERGEAWNQTVRLAIEPEDVPGCHLIMSIADAAINFPFALCWMPLWTADAFVHDGDHGLLLHRYDEHTSEMIAGKRAYLGLPWSSKGVKDESGGPLASLQLRTFLCSTKYSQDPVLLGLLKWKEQSQQDILTLLSRLQFVEEFEIIKLLSDLLDTLFLIIVDFNDDQTEDAVFSALVFVFNIVHDRRFNLQPRIDEYAKEHFNSPAAFSRLLRCFRRLIRDPLNPVSSRKLRSASKVGNYVFKFMIEARKQQVAKEAASGSQSLGRSISRDVEGIFYDIEDLMRNSARTLIGSKTLIVRHFPAWLIELSNSLTSADLLAIAHRVVESCASVQGKLVIWKLLMINGITAANVFDANDGRTWDKSVVAWTMPYWGKPTVPLEQWREQVRVCCSIAASQRSTTGFISPVWLPKLVDSFLEVQEVPREPMHNYSPLFPSTYPFPSKALSEPVEFDEVLIEVSALLATTTRDLANYPVLDKDENAELLEKLLRTMSMILDCEAFPPTWLSLHVYHHKTILESLQAIFSILIEQFLPPPDEAEHFPTETWNEFFSTLLKLVSSDALALETFPEQKRRAVWKIAGDIRELGALLLQRSWNAIAWDTSEEERGLYEVERMGGYQVQYVPGLVGFIVELSLSVHEGLRSTAIDILKTMIVSEWALAKDLATIQTEMIGCLDQMFRTRKPADAIVQKVFIAELLAAFEVYANGLNVELFAAVKSLVDIIDELLDLLVAVHSAEGNGEAFQIVDTLRLMEFLKDLQKENIYIGYVHKLASIQKEGNHHTEAGLALRMHAEIYAWNPIEVLDPLEDPVFPLQTAFQRKEQLYFDTISHFEDGGAWHQALAAYTDLAEVYQTVTFDFAKLARTQRAMAAIYEKIGRNDKHQSRFFRVVFRGLGFSPRLRDKEYIFEAAQTDRVSTFADKLLLQYPAARVVSGPMADRELEGQYLTIYPVSPQRNLLHPSNRRPKVVQSVRDHFMLFEPQQFTLGSRREANASGVGSQTQEKTVYSTAEAFPNILRCSEIVGKETIQLSPTQIGLERTMRKTLELVALENKALGRDEPHMSNLTDQLKLLLRPELGGSVAEYWSLLPSPDDIELDLENGELKEEEVLKTLSPLEEALEAALFDHIIVIRRCLTLYSPPSLQAIRAEFAKNVFEPVIDALVAVENDDSSKSWLWNLAGNDPEPVAVPAPLTPRARAASVARASIREMPNGADGNPAPLPPSKIGPYVMSGARRRSGVGTRPAAESTTTTTATARDTSAPQKSYHFLSSRASNHFGSYLLARQEQSKMDSETPLPTDTFDSNGNGNGNGISTSPRAPQIPRKPVPEKRLSRVSRRLSGLGIAAARAGKGRSSGDDY